MEKKKLPSILGTKDAYEFVQSYPASEAMIDEVIKRLLEYSRSDDALYIIEFLRLMNIPKSTYLLWRKNWPKLNDAHKEAKEFIGVNRMVGAAKRKYDKGIILYSQYRFGSEWLKDAEFNKKTEDQRRPDVHVHIKTDESVEEVPDRNDK